MKLITFEHDGSSHVGAIDSSRSTAVSFTTASDGDPRCVSMLDLIKAGADGVRSAQDLLNSAADHAVHDLKAVTLKAPLGNPVRLRASSLVIAAAGVQHLSNAR